MDGDLYGRVREATRDLMVGLSLELVDVEITRDKGRPSLRLSIDKPGGVNVEDCAKASRLIGQVLDRERVLQGPYVLEVMSPGLDRPLKRPVDYESNVGKRAMVKLLEPVEGRGRFTGRIVFAGEDEFGLEYDGGEVVLGYGNVSNARLDPELPW